MESGVPGENQATKILNQIMEDPRLRSHFRLGNLTFIPKKEHPNGCILRSADILITEWQRNHWEMEFAEASGDIDSGWTQPFRLLFKDQSSPPIRHYHINQRALKNSAVWAAMLGIHPHS
jgi:hypothetical protein